MENNLALEHKNAELILKVGWRLFQQKGFRGVSVDELCLECGLSKPTLYYYFHDKETLFVQVLQYQLHGFHAVIERPGTLTERLQRTAASILESFQTQYSALLHDREHIKDLNNQRHIREAFHCELFDPLIALMRVGIEQGELDGDDPELLSLVFLGIVNNFIGRSGEQALDKTALAQKLTNYFLKGTIKYE